MPQSLAMLPAPDSGSDQTSVRAPSVRLSKSKFLAGSQCHKRLYLEVHQPGLATPPDEQQQAILDMGSEVGELARRRFPGGVLVEADHRHVPEALRRTEELLADPSVPAIFEAAFQWDRVLIRVDVLQRVALSPAAASQWRLIEVKSSTRVKDVHLDDLAVQTHVLRGVGLALAGSWLMHINTRYVYAGGDPDLTQLFALQDLTAAVAARQSEVRSRLAAMKAMLMPPTAPVVEPDGHCHTPYECPFWNHCTKDKPDRWIFHLPGGARTAHELIRRGVETIDEIPPDFKLTPLQRRVRDQAEWVGPRLKARLETVRYPVHHLDFETFMPAIPRFPLTRPYQAIPTQWSNHVETEDGLVQHHEFLSMDPRDSRSDLIEALLDSVGGEGSICVYSAYERAILEGLAEAFPKFASDLRRVTERLWDLLPVLRGQYYHPAFEGSFSIKAVLPALLPELGYADLDIQEGGVAAQAYGRMVFEETDLVEKLRLREALLRYCERDTLAMLRLRQVLLEKARGLEG
jgi:hypothetical protein